MNKSAKTLLLTATLAMLSGCKSPVRLYATRPALMRAATAPRLERFESSEQPALVVELPKGCRWGQKAGTLWVDEALTGTTVWNQSQFMREGTTNYFLPQGLAAGTYFATLRSEGEPVVSINFDVR